MVKDTDTIDVQFALPWHGTGSLKEGRFDEVPWERQMGVRLPKDG